MPDQRSRLTPYFLLFAIIFTPLSFVVAHGGRYAGQLRLLALLAVLLLALAKPLLDLDLRARNDPEEGATLAF